MRVLVTQSAADAAAAVTALEARGHAVMAVPLLSAEPVTSPKVNLTAAQGFIVTSVEGARALAEHVGVRTFPVFADSALTAATLRGLGFKNVSTANDDSADLARLIERSIKPANGALIYACSSTAPVNLPTMLGNMGFAVRLLPLFTMKRADAIPEALRTALRDKQLDAALFLSADEARAFVALIQRAELEAAVQTLPAVAASPVVAAPLRGLKLAGVSVAKAGDLATVVSVLDAKLVDRVAEEQAARDAKVREEAERTRAEEQRRATEKAARERIAAAQAAAEAAERERLAQERAERERLAAEKAAAEKAERAEQERLAREQRAEKERLEHEQRAEQERIERERLAAAKVERERLATEKAAAEKAARERLARERVEKERIERERRAAANAEQDRIARERAEAERLNRERLAAERAEQDRIAREKAEAERRARERLAQEEIARANSEKERLALQRAEEQRIALEKAEGEKLERTRIAQEHAEQERIAREQRAEQDRIERERRAAEKIEQDRIAAEKAAAEKIERERIAAALAEQERLAREQRAEKERLGRERMAAEKASRDRLAQEKAQADRRERERLAAEKAEQDRIAAEKAAADKAERERLARERDAQERITREQRATEKAEQGRIAREKAAAARAEQDRLKRERTEQERSERERLAAERAAAREAERAAKEEQKRLQRLHKVQENAERAATLPVSAGWLTRATQWMGRNSTPDTAAGALTPPSIWNMSTGLDLAAKPPRPAPEASETAPVPGVAQDEPSATMRATIASAAPFDGPQAREELTVPENQANADTPAKDVSLAADTAAETPSDTLPASDKPHVKPTPRSGGRAARLRAEDAADQRAQGQRFKYLGHSEAQPEPETDSPPPPPPEFTREPIREAAPERKRSGGGRAVGLFFLLAIAAAAVVGGMSWMKQRDTVIATAPTTTAPTPSQAEIDRLQARLNALEQKPAAPTPAPAAVPSAAPAPAADVSQPPAPDASVLSLSDTMSSQARQLAVVSARLATLEAAIGNAARLEDLSKRINTLEGRSADANSVLALADRVAALETTAQRALTEHSNSIALLMAVAQWREAVLAGRGFALELETVKTLAARTDTLTIDDAAFAAAAPGGVATLTDLQRRFTAAAAAATRAGAIPDDTQAWYRRILERAMSIVTVRRLDGDAAGTSTAAVLARAQGHLAAGDLAGTVNELDGLNGAAATALTPWLTEARTRVAAERAAGEATTKAMAALAAVGKAPAATTGNGP